MDSWSLKSRTIETIGPESTNEQEHYFLRDLIIIALTLGMEQFKMAGCIWATKMEEPPLHSIGKIIQWATNQQLDLMVAYEKQWGVALDLVDSFGMD